jgi:hypothetical protein
VHALQSDACIDTLMSSLLRDVRRMRHRANWSERWKED